MTFATDKCVIYAEAEGGATLFVGGLTDNLTEEELRGVFSLYGDLVSFKCLPAKGCAFVQYTTTAAAKAAMTMLQGRVLCANLFP